MSVVSSLDGNLFLQVITVLPSIFVFIVALEGFGFSLLRILTPLLGRLDNSTPTPNGVVRVFVGGLFYALVFLVLGELCILTKPMVLGVSLAIPTLAFALGQRWKGLSWSRLRAAFGDNRPIILGTTVFGLMTFAFWFRPITGFDSVWYHLTIPKLFLQSHDVRNQGGLVLYSLQPSMDYFWNLWPLSLPVSTAVASIMISGIQAVLVCLSLGFMANIGKHVWGWKHHYQFAAPILIGSSFEGISLLGIGGNDLLGLAFGVVATLYCFYTLSKQKVTWSQLTIGVLLVVGVATIKVFFTVYAAMILVYFIVEAWPKLPDSKHIRKQFIRLASVLLIAFVLAYLPWLLRAYLATGRPFDPLGIPELSARFYIDQGGGTAANHWTDFIFKRFYASIGPMLFFIYTPLVLAGVLSIFNKHIRARAANLWTVACLGFLVVFFASITLAWRYYIPEATILAFLGFAVLAEISKDFDFFRHLVLAAVFVVLVLSTMLRVVYTSSATAGAQVTDASIQKLLYVRHFTNVNDYLDKKVTADYGYVQQQSPPGLTPNEKILVGNTYPPILILQQPISNYDVRNIHNLAYVKNPLLEPTMEPGAFENIKNVGQLKSVLRSHKIRYIVSRKSMAELCQYVGVQNASSCDDPTVFKPVLNDNTWQVNWYMMVGN